MNWKIKVFRIIAGLLIVVIPAVLGYCQTRMEIKSKYEENRTHAGAAYARLASSVDELQKTVEEQHDTLIQLQAYVMAMEAFMAPNQTRQVTMHYLRPKLPPAPTFSRLSADYNSLK